MDTLNFWLNGQPVAIERPSTQVMLIDFLRSSTVALAGPKKPCGQGGCGGCTVMLSEWEQETGQARHRAINACLHPLVALNGLVVTTVEGTGGTQAVVPLHLNHNPTFGRTGVDVQHEPLPSIASAKKVASSKHQARCQLVASAKTSTNSSPAPAELEVGAGEQGMNPVAHCLAINNGTQCGYCTVGFVMAMSEFLVNTPNATKREIEEALDGNLCRCTGYRPILTGMKTFASDWEEKDEENRMKCVADADSALQLPLPVITIPFPAEAMISPQPLSLDSRAGERRWLAPRSVDELAQTMRAHEASQTFLCLANTSYGIYPQEFKRASTVIDLRFVPELNAPPEVTDHHLRVGAGMSYTDLITAMEEAAASRQNPSSVSQDPETTCHGAIRFMARRTAGRIVRNAASLGGNTMLVLKHIASGTGEPFPSDILTALDAINAQIQYLDAQTSAPSRCTINELVERVLAEPALASRIVLLAYFIPFGDANDVVLSQKVALREVNSHSIVNATTRLTVNADLVIEDASLVFGGIAPYPWHARAVEAALKGQPLSLATFPVLAAHLAQEIGQQFVRWEERYAELAYEGVTNDYRAHLATAFLFKALVNALAARGALGQVPPAVASCGEIKWGRWPVSCGKQSFESRPFTAPVAQPYIKLTAMAQATGQLHYTQEVELPPSTVHGAFVLSRRAVANFLMLAPDATSSDDIANDHSALRQHLHERFEGFVTLLTSDVFQQKEEGINFQGMGMDQPIFAVSQVSYVGQSLALVVAESDEKAHEIAAYVTRECVQYSPVPQTPGQPSWWNQPVLNIDEALRCNSIFPDWPQCAPFLSHIWRITRPGSQLDWVQSDKQPLDKAIRQRAATIDGVSCQVVESTQSTGGQKHFYMETQAAIVEPKDGNHYSVIASTQSPTEMHASVAMALGLRYSNVDVKVPSVGGAFGGKTGMTCFVVAPAALAARATRRPVRLVVPREQDSALMGKRHAYYGQYQIAIDDGRTNPANKGTIRGLVNRMWGDGGAFYDYSFLVSNCIMTRADNAYRVPNFQTQIDVCRTNTAPSTAFRAFGDIQSKLMFENAIDDAAHAVGMTAEDVREKNLYERGDVTPFGQSLPFCYVRQVWSYLKDTCHFEDKAKQVQEFNANNRWRKRGVAMIPVKYGSGYNSVMLEQAAAVVSVYSGDGSVVIHQGGVEMGQGLLTQAKQMASYILNIPLDMISVRSPETSVIPNPSISGASTGTCYTAEAVKQLCEALKKRLIEFGYNQLTDKGNEWCTAQGIDFWNYGVAGWNSQAASQVPGTSTLIWQNLVALAFQNRISLVASINASITGGETPMANLTSKDPRNPDEQPLIPGYQSTTNPTTPPTPMEICEFVDFTYSAACSVVEVDILTGESKVLSTDIAYDIGYSMNPALDIGQVEGAFVQGLGYILCEKLEFEPSGPEAGRLNSLNTWDYKIPATTSIPLEFNVHLFPRSTVKDVPVSPYKGPLSSKEVGEPPLVLSATVFFALKAAVRASRLERGLSGLFRLDAPATVQEVVRACEITPADLI